jgi:hypothetical protein
MLSYNNNYSSCFTLVKYNTKLRSKHCRIYYYAMVAGIYKKNTGIKKANPEQKKQAKI